MNIQSIWRWIRLVIEGSDEMEREHKRRCQVIRKIQSEMRYGYDIYRPAPKRNRRGL
jgi:hypothetical protein